MILSGMQELQVLGERLKVKGESSKGVRYSLRNRVPSEDLITEYC